MRILLSLIFSLLLISNAYAESGWSGDVASDIRNDTLYFDNNLSSLDDTVQKALETLDELTAGGSMVYPSAGIPLSTGSAWGTSITDNSSNWNTAYSWGQGLKLDQTTPQTVINGVPSITNGLLIGSDANLTDFPLAKFISSAGNTGHTYTGNIGTIGEAVAGVADTGTGVGGVAKTNGANQGRGVAGVGKVSATGDGGASIGGYFRAEDTHAGGRNIGCYAFATGGLYNNALYLAGGDIYSPPVAKA